MSNSVYGYFYFDNTINVTEELRVSKRPTSLGLFQIHPSELYNFPPDLLPRKNTKPYCFLIGDNPSTRNATYLVDGYDYESSAGIALPLKSADRIELLADLLEDLMALSGDRRLYVAITDCDQIEKTKRIPSQEIKDELLKDIGTEGPPDTLYCLRSCP